MLAKASQRPIAKEDLFEQIFQKEATLQWAIDFLQHNDAEEAAYLALCEIAGKLKISGFLKEGFEFNENQKFISAYSLGECIRDYLKTEKKAMPFEKFLETVPKGNYQKPAFELSFTRDKERDKSEDNKDLVAEEFIKSEVEKTTKKNRLRFLSLIEQGDSDEVMDRFLKFFKKNQKKIFPEEFRGMEIEASLTKKHLESEFYPRIRDCLQRSGKWQYSLDFQEGN